MPAISTKKDRATPPRKEAENKYAPSSWGSSGIGQVEDVTVPSGQLCAVRRPGLEGLMKAGVLSNVDVLGSLITKEMDRRKSTATAEGRNASDVVPAVAELLNDPEKFSEMIYVIDRVLCHVVVQPPLHMTPNDVTRRESSLIYCDMLDLDDKVFIFEFAVGGTRDLERFRDESAAAVAGVDSRQDVGGSTE